MTGIKITIEADEEQTNSNIDLEVLEKMHKSAVGADSVDIFYDDYSESINVGGQAKLIIKAFECSMFEDSQVTFEQFKRGYKDGLQSMVPGDYSIEMEKKEGW